MFSNKRSPHRRSHVIEEIEPRILYAADFSPALLHASPLPVAEQRTISASGEFVNPTSIEAEHATAQQTRHEIAFVDTATPDYQALVEDLKSQSSQGRQIDVVLLDNRTNGIEQITNCLRETKEIDAIHVISHGADGTIQVRQYATRLSLAA